MSQSSLSCPQKGRTRQRRLRAVLAGFGCLCAAWLSPVPAQSVVELRDARLPAQGEHHSVFSVARFGRYAVGVSSPQGTAMQLVDRQAGPLEIYGEPGKADGRLDIFLERGDYLLRTLGDARAEGEARLSVRPFVELHEPAPRLVELKPVQDGLEDFQQRSYWLEISEPRSVVLEAAGRYLADLRLWQDGTWLVDAEPETAVLEARSGQPLTRCRLIAHLEPGLYLLTAYGGPGQPWAEQSPSTGSGQATASPFYLRYGIPALSEAGRQRFTLSEFGVDYWLVPRPANYFRLELPLAVPDEASMGLGLGGYDPQAPAFTAGELARIDKNSRLPVAEATHHTHDAYHLVEIRGTPGQAYVLQHFEQRAHYTFDGGGQYWLGTLHSGFAADSIDATALLVLGGNDLKDAVADDRAVRLSPERGWRRRFNLTGPASLFLFVAKTGTYRLDAEGVAAKFRIEPFLTHYPEAYRPPDYRPGGHAWDLDTGYYVLRMEPERRGILTLSLAAPPSPSRAPGQPGADTPAQAAAQFGVVRLSGERYSVYLNQMPEVASGIVLRPLPVDLGSAALPVSLRAGEEVSIPVRLPEAGMLAALREDGGAAELAVDQGGWQNGAALGAGQYTLRLRAPAGGGESLSLEFMPARLDPTTPLPPLPDTALAALPDFPVLDAGAPRYFDLERGRGATFKVHVERPALYRLETTGLLATAGNLRTRVRPNLFEVQSNGVGRNALVQYYLGRGDYQFTVSALGESRGHLGLQLAATPLLDGGLLEPGNPARATLPPGQALAYRFHVEKAGDYRLRVLGLDRAFKLRLEDRDGWPVVTPGQQADASTGSATGLTLRLEPGEYRAIVLPEAVQARALALLDWIPGPPRFEGHGPHKLPLATTVEHLWEEPSAAGQPRTPDQWDFELSAPAEVTVALDNDMRAELQALDSGPLPAHSTSSGQVTVAAGRGWKGELPAGTYRLQAAQRRPNNRVPYSLSVTPKQLLPGQSRHISAPARIPLSLGRDGLAEIYSVGGGDVRARLYDAQDRLIAVSDDREDDWNFHIGTRLAPGQYALQVDPVGEETADTQVFLRTPPERQEAALALPAQWSVQDDAVHIYPLAVPVGQNFLVVAAQAEESVGLALERQAGTDWASVGTRQGRAARLELPVQAGAHYRLRVWAADRRHTPLNLQAMAAAVPLADEAQLAQGVPALEVAGGAVAAIALRGPGLFRLAMREGLRAGDGGSALQDQEGEMVYGLGQTLWLAVGTPLPQGEGAGVRVQFSGERLHLQAGGGLPLSVPPLGKVKVDAAPGDGPLLFWAQARAGQPGVRVLPSPEPVPELVEGGSQTAGLDIAPHAAIAVALDAPRAAAEVWNAGAADLPLETRLRYFRFPAPTSASLAWGATQGSLVGQSARQFDLPPGDKQIDLTLPPATAALLLEAGRIAGTYWSGESGSAESLHSRADSLLLLHAATGTDPFDRLRASSYSLSLAPAAPAQTAPLAAGGLWRQVRAAAGTLRLPVVAGVKLHIEGAQQAQFIGEDGRALEGARFATTAPGTLVLRHGPGVVAVWAERPPGAAPPPASEITPPAGLALGGAQQSVRYTTAQAALLHLRSDAPLIARWAGPEQEHLALYPYGARLDLYAPPGATTLTLYPLGGGDLSGQAQFSATPVETLAQGVGPPVLLAGGAARAFAFTLKEERTVGLGLRASSDLADGLLLDSRGRALGEGVVHYRKLAAGTYVLVARVPPEAAPVRVEPVALGLEAGYTGPPPELIRRFVEAGSDTGMLTSRQVDGADTQTDGEEEDGQSYTPEEEDPGEEDTSDEEEETPSDEGAEGE